MKPRLICCGLLMIAWVAIPSVLRADTVKLKDGTELEGEIVAESETNLSIYLEFSHGTITQTRPINKDAVAEIIRWTPEQKAQWLAQRDYQNLQRYQLNPNTSYAPEYYDKIIHDVYDKFLTQHPDSPSATNVAERRAEWMAERDLVAAGNIKLRGRWSPAAETAPLVERAHGQQLLERGRLLISQGKFESAVQWLQPIFSMSRQSELISQAKPLLVSAHQQAIASLNHQRQQLENDIAAAQQQVDQAQAASNQAQSSQSSGGNLPSIVRAPAAVSKTGNDLNFALNQLDQLQSQLAVVTEKLTALKSPKLVETVAAYARDSQPATPAPSSTAGPTDLLVGMLTWVKDHWLVLATAGLAILFLMSRLAKG
jgi:hypothetical protein